jgi:hypothetical protein
MSRPTPRQTRRRITVVALLSVLSVLAAACSSSDEPSVTDGRVESGSTGSLDERAGTIEAGAALEVADIPALVAEWASGQGDALDLARRIVGLPFELAPPEGSSPWSLLGTVRRPPGVEGADWEWQWEYEALTGPVGEIDATLPDGGKGTVDAKAAFDALFEPFGWTRYVEEVDPIFPAVGTADSARFAYQPGSDALRVGGIELSGVFAGALASPDLDSFEGPERPGLRIGVWARTEELSIPSPVLDAIRNALPTDLNAELTDAELVAINRRPQDPQIIEGERYLEATITLSISPGLISSGGADSAKEILSSGLAGSAFQIGRESSASPGVIEVVLPTVTGEIWTESIIFLERYPGEINIIADSSTGAGTMTVTVLLEPNREVLQGLS